MPRHFLAALVLALSQAAAQSIAITDVAVIDVATGDLRNGVTVLTQGDRIAQIGPKIAIPRGATRVNGKGKFLIPGLWDMHTHIQGAGADTLDLFVAKGVVGARDMGSDADFILPLRDRIKSGAVLGPEIVASGPMLDDAPQFPWRRRVTNAREAKEAVADLKRLGVDFIKVHDHTPREVFFAIAEEAPRQGLTFAGHVPQAVKVQEAADAGIRSIEHLSNYEVFGECVVGDEYKLSDCRRLFEKLASKGVWQTPTLAFFQTLPDIFSGTPIAHADYASDGILKLHRENVELSHIEPKTLERMRLAAKVARTQVIPDLAALGNRFLAGCDGMVPGFCLHDELEWFTKAGFTPLQALQTATLNPARFLGREATQGTVTAGKRADLILLEANPLSDIRNVARIDQVVVRGKLVTKQETERVVARHRRTGDPK
jgi:imidazolonepropionase-like amidohydrolase